MSDISEDSNGKSQFVKKSRTWVFGRLGPIAGDMRRMMKSHPNTAAIYVGFFNRGHRIVTMFSQAMRDVCKPSYLGIIGELKRSGGLAIPELAKLMDMSYMGVKQHCVKLEKLGYLKVWRVPRIEVGRPQKLYKLTSKCDPLFPSGGAELVLALLEGVKATFGETAPEKLLYHYLENERDDWIKAVRPGKSLVEKATRFAEARIHSGHFCHCHYSAQDGFVIEEYHHPLHQVLKLYPGLLVMETRMIEQVLGTRVERTERKGSQGVKCTVYQVSTLG